MNLSELYFNKPLNEVTEKDLTDFFTTERTENTSLEFKSYNPNGNFDQKLSAIIEAICAFSNSEGGLLIWGAPQGKVIEGRKEKIFIGELTPITNQALEHDRLHSQLIDKITPIPAGVQIHIVSGQYVIVYVEKSQYPPHQYEGIYRMRLDGKTVAAPHHYVEAMFKQVRYPNIEGYLKFYNNGIINNVQHLGIPSPAFKLQVHVFIINFSDFINEEQPNFSLVTKNGTFLGERNLYNGKHEYREKNFRDLLSSGEPISFAKEIMYSNNTQEDTLILSYYGKKSPMRRSQYVIDLSQVWGNSGGDIIISKVTLNQLIKDYQEGLNVSKQDILKKILGKYYPF